MNTTANAWPQWFMACMITMGFLAGVYSSTQQSHAFAKIIIADIGINAFTVYALYCGGFWIVWGWAP